MAGVKEETGSKLSDTAGACFLAGMLVAIAGVSTRPAAAAAATSLDPVLRATLSTIDSLSLVHIVGLR